MLVRYILFGGDGVSGDRVLGTVLLECVWCVCEMFGVELEKRVVDKKCRDLSVLK